MIIVDTALKARAEAGNTKSEVGNDWGGLYGPRHRLTKFSITSLVCGWSLISNRTLENARKQAYALAGAEKAGHAHTVGTALDRRHCCRSISV